MVAISNSFSKDPSRRSSSATRDPCTFTIILRSIAVSFTVFVMWPLFCYKFIFAPDCDSCLSSGIISMSLPAVETADVHSPLKKALLSGSSSRLGAATEYNGDVARALDNGLTFPDQVQPTECGLPSTPIDCPQGYKIGDVQQSAVAGGSAVSAYMAQRLAASMARAGRACQNVGSTRTRSNEATGGWCLVPHTKKTGSEFEIVQDGGKIVYPLADKHVRPSSRNMELLVKLIKTEQVTSISDFGAGIGQYKAAVQAEFPALEYNAYDGAGNVETYTKGAVRYFDLTVPLNLPITEWVLCFEVGEHVPSKFEGMMIRNLHRHNTKGIILSWGVLGQEGLAHVNNHSNQYLQSIFQNLGYTLDKEMTEAFRTEQPYWFFKKSLMVFRRNEPNMLAAA